MSVSVTGLRRYSGPLRLDSVAARERSVLRRVKIAYGLLFFNTLTYGGSLITLPSKVGKALPNGALPLALLLLLTVNPKLKLRPNVFLCLVGLLVLDTIFTAVQQTSIGTDYRTIRFIEFLIALWLMTPWWGRADMLLFRVHLRLLYIALISVFLGLLISPRKALPARRQDHRNYLEYGCHECRSVRGGRRRTDSLALAGPPHHRAYCCHRRPFQRHDPSPYPYQNRSRWTDNRAACRRHEPFRRQRSGAQALRLGCPHHIDDSCHGRRLHNHVAGPR